MSYETEGALRVAAYEAEKERDALRAENEALKEHLADTRRMLLCLSNRCAGLFGYVEVSFQKRLKGFEKVWSGGD